MSLPERYGYLIGVGSNIEPRANCERIIEALLQRFGRISLSSVVATAPVGVETPNEFVNFMVYLQTSIGSDELKQWSNSVEKALGRDRNHPQRKLIDRPADIDTLQQLSVDEHFDCALVSESYYREVSHELAAHIQNVPLPLVQFPRCLLRLSNGLEIGDRAATIDLDRATGDIGIIQ